MRLTEICLLLLLGHPGGYHGGQAGDEGLAGLVCPARLPLLLPETKTRVKSGCRSVWIHFSLSPLFTGFFFIKSGFSLSRSLPLSLSLTTTGAQGDNRALVEIARVQQGASTSSSSCSSSSEPPGSACSSSSTQRNSVGARHAVTVAGHFGQNSATIQHFLTLN